MNVAKSAVIGTMRHDLFELCLLQRNFSHEFAKQNIPHIVRKHAETLIGCGIYNDQEAVREVMRVLPQMQRFATEFTTLINSNQGNTTGVLDGMGGVHTNVSLKADSVYATEEATISPELGLKGFVDATVEATITNCTPIQTHFRINGKKDDVPYRSLVAIELKTGHNQNTQHAHAAQLSLYTLTLRSRHGSAIMGSKNVNGQAGEFLGMNGAANGGILLYLNHESFRAVHVSPEVNEIKSLLNQRNIVATEIRRASKPRGVMLEYECENDGTSDSKKKVKR